MSHLQQREKPMSKRFDMRCPECGDTDHITIAAIVNVRLTSLGTEVQDDAPTWTSENGAGCEACGYEGIVREFENLTGLTVVQ
jgi:hypothetical protein